jgi:hypothetical protein
MNFTRMRSGGEGVGRYEHELYITLIGKEERVSIAVEVVILVLVLVALFTTGAE